MGINIQPKVITGNTNQALVFQPEDIKDNTLWVYSETTNSIILIGINMKMNELRIITTIERLLFILTDIKMEMYPFCVNLNPQMNSI